MADIALKAPVHKSISGTLIRSIAILVKTVDIFSFWDHKGKVEDLTFSDHEAEAEAFVKSRS